MRGGRGVAPRPHLPRSEPGVIDTEQQFEREGDVTEASGGRAVRERRIRMRGEMLWFNAAKDLGALRTDAGARLDVRGRAFAPGERPAERCAGKKIEFEAQEGVVSGVMFLPEPSPRRARMRHRR